MTARPHGVGVTTPLSGDEASKTLALCADDFGLSRGVSQGIATLARGGRINAISCLANMPPWRACAAMLNDVPAAVDLGMHFNLSEGAPLSEELRAHWPSLPKLPTLIARAHVGALPLEAIAAEFAAQYRCFVEATGCEPAFIDGHQHVHHLPGVRGVVLEGIAGAATMPAVRNTACVLGPGFGVKRALIAGTGGHALQRELVRRGIAHNAALLGVYDFRPSGYRERMRGWLANVPDEGALLFCHPGLPDEGGAPDPIAAARSHEAEYLASDRFIGDLREAGATLGPVWRQVSAPSRTSRRG